ncbi:distal tail protein Dit [Paenibacillus ehimensis]|uniref:Phage tail family protein n=1 Tax=Paenibacillus ehimensis TaxID=79264 RepID=A0ABT8VHV5_9BACL|nr:distal tail protein Dit [Paenibacillus ehimensis]MDO3680569.1 phage tail family protein [Paenibacillus ehimensis]
MTSMVWLGSKSNDDLGFVVKGTSKRPALPGTVDRTVTIPGRHGAWDYGADLSPRQFVLECAFLTRDAFVLQQKVVALAAHLVDSYGRPRDMELRFRERPDQYFIARFVGSFDIDRIIGTGVFSLPFTAYDPFAYGPEKIYETTITTSPFSFEIDSGGNVRTQPVIVLTNVGTSTIRTFKIVNEYLVE